MVGQQFLKPSARRLVEFLDDSFLAAAQEVRIRHFWRSTHRNRRRKIRCQAVNGSFHGGKGLVSVYKNCDDLSRDFTRVELERVPLDENRFRPLRFMEMDAPRRISRPVPLDPGLSRPIRRSPRWPQ